MGDDQQVSAGEPAVPGAEQQDGQAKGPLSGLMPGGGGAAAPAAPESGSPGGLLGGGALPSGFPGLPGGLSGAGGDGQSPTLILGGFSVLVMPLRGMSLSNIASMMSGGQQMMQLLPKPGVGWSGAAETLRRARNSLGALNDACRYQNIINTTKHYR